MSENNKKWYVLRAAGGKEKKAKEYLEKEIERCEKRVTTLSTSVISAEASRNYYSCLVVYHFTQQKENEHGKRTDSHIWQGQVPG